MGHDRHLLHRVSRRSEPRDDRVTRLVIGDEPPLLGVDELPMSRTEADFVMRLFEIGHRDHSRVVASGGQGRFVAQIGEVRAAETDGHAGQGHEIYVIREAQVARMNVQNSLTSLAVR